ncbi:50S ribosomal protein L15e [Candidatus Pacearchaeota archaeon]|jgi:large subunit ribosomal protein L15e|nr:50S ribosomal protein L15e [Candidatus Pacearchaeota archaeon]
MVQGLYGQVKKLWLKPSRELMQPKLIAWRAGNSVEKVEKPLRLDRARALGYKAKKGFVIARVRVVRGGRKRERAGVKGRSTRKQTNRKTLGMNYQWVAEQRAGRKFANLEVLNSYWVGKDGKHYFYEVILIDPSRPEIAKGRTTKWIVGAGAKRAQRGLTSAARKSRGLQSNKGHSPTLKVRPSSRANSRKGK